MLEEGGVTLRASGRSCSGLYGKWRVRLLLSGAATGSGETAFVLSPGTAAAAPLSFPIRAGLLAGRAAGLLHVAAKDGMLIVRGRVQVKLPFETVSRPLHLEIPVTRGPTPECGIGSRTYEVNAHRVAAS